MITSIAATVNDENTNYKDSDNNNNNDHSNGNDSDSSDSNKDNVTSNEKTREIKIQQKMKGVNRHSEIIDINDIECDATNAPNGFQKKY